MKTRRAITIGVTFVAGLYFILDFVVPPTLPGASYRGVVAGVTPPTFYCQSIGQGPVNYNLGVQGTAHPKIYMAQRDILGQPKLASVHLREVEVGSTVTVRMGPIKVQRASPFNPLTLESEEGTWFTLRPGQVWIDAGSSRHVSQPGAGMSLLVEQSDAKVAAVNRGSVQLLSGGTRVAHSLQAKTAALRLSRFGSAKEQELDELRVGDTAQFGPATLFADNRDTAAQFNLVITTMAFGIGLLSLGIVHSKILVNRRPEWYLSLFFFAAVALGVAAGLGKYESPGTSSRVFSDFVVLRIISSVTSTVFSLLAFYMAAAAYRAFRIKTAEAGLMMASALIVMLGQTPFGLYITSWMGERLNAFWLPNVAAWILRVPTTAMFRGIIFGVMLGAIATALRYWLSMERSISSEE